MTKGGIKFQRLATPLRNPTPTPTKFKVRFLKPQICETIALKFTTMIHDDLYPRAPLPTKTWAGKPTRTGVI